MTFPRRLRIAAATLAAAAVAAPLAGAKPISGTASFGGQSDSQLVQIGGVLVKPENLSAWQASQGRSAAPSALPSSDSGFGWHDAGVGFGIAVGGMLFVGAAEYVRRMRAASPC